MNANRLINMVIRQITRRLVNLGINKGIDLASKRGRKDADLTEADRDQARDAKEMAKRARQAQRATKRIGRF